MWIDKMSDSHTHRAPMLAMNLTQASHIGVIRICWALTETLRPNARGQTSLISRSRHKEQYGMGDHQQMILFYFKICIIVILFVYYCKGFDEMGIISH